MFRRHPHAPCVVTKVRTVCGTRTELVTALAGGESEQAATATAHAQVASRWPGATILNARHHT